MDGMRRMLSCGVSADMLLTDIPYDGVNRKAQLRNLDKGAADIKTFNLAEYINLALKVVKFSFVIFCAWAQVSEISSLFIAHGLSTRLMVWEKTNPSPMNGDYLYLSGIEMAVYAKRLGAPFNGHCKNTVFRHPICANQIHPTQKPIALFSELIKDNTNAGDIVLDTCMGSGTSGIAARKLGRKYIGFEIDPTFWAVAQKRIDTEFLQQSFLYD
jgi:DNA modification methylase